MNSLEKKMFLILREIKSYSEEVILKADFEAEGTRLLELTSLCGLAFRAGVKLFLKIGGCEAVLDLNFCRDFAVDGVMVPMVESAYSLKKFKMACKKIFKDCSDDVFFILNAETKTCFLNFDEILKEGEGFLNGVTIGRVDLSCSLGLSRKEIDGDEVLNYCKILAEKAKHKGLILSVGGGVLKSSFEVLKKLEPHINRFETRKFIFNFDGNFKNFEENVKKATEFELLYLENKSLKYKDMSKEDLSRIQILKNRV